MTIPTPESIRAAAARIAGDVRRTPLWRLPGAALGLRCAEVWLKLEQVQVGGSFKARGMFNRMRALPVPPAGVVVASGGNAGIAVATAAQSLGVACDIAWAVQRQGFIAASHLVDDGAIRDAQRRMWRDLRLAVEPAAALPLAALWTGLVQPAPHERVAVIVCGANLDTASLA